MSLYDCLNAYRKPERLGKTNAWFCSNCKEHLQAQKKIDIYEVPNILIINLMRFKSQGGYFREKLTDKVIFPQENLDLTDYVVSA